MGLASTTTLALAVGLAGCGGEDGAANASHSSDITSGTGTSPGGGGATGQGGAGQGGAGQGGTGQGGANVEGATALLEIYPLDLWAQPLLAGEASIEVTRAGAKVSTSGGKVLTVPLSTAGTYTIALSAPDHHPLEFTGTQRLYHPSLVS